MNRMNSHSMHEFTGTEDFKHPIDHHILYEVQSQFSEEPCLVCREFKCLADAVIANSNISPPLITFEQALEAYFLIVHTLQNVL